jgi:GH24 family phage-related lysozyme (muramidase)
VARSSQAAIDLIVREEVGSQALYKHKYQHPEWPGGASGVTIGIGYDCGYAEARQIAADWGDKLSAAMVKALESVAGIIGAAARSHAAELEDIVVVPWDAAMAVFAQRDLPKWEEIVAHALQNADKLSGDSFGALVSLAYNRGASFHKHGDRYIEMRNIAGLMAAERLDRIPHEIRGMKRLWPNVRDLRDRRDHEAALFEKGLRP